jgi:hypothetical protein
MSSGITAIASMISEGIEVNSVFFEYSRLDALVLQQLFQIHVSAISAAI